jgi:hypothetical protein
MNNALFFLPDSDSLFRCDHKNFTAEEARERRENNIQLSARSLYALLRRT